MESASSQSYSSGFVLFLMKPVRAPPSYCFKIYLIITFLLYPDPSCTFPHKIPLFIYPLFHTCHMPFPSSLFDHLNSTRQNILFLTVQFPPFSCYLVSLRLSYTFPRTYSRNPQLTRMFFLQHGRRSFTFVWNKKKVIVLCIIVIIFVYETRSHLKLISIV
jgi:hypothetical protein